MPDALDDAFRRLVARGYRVRWTDLRMTYEGYSEAHPAGRAAVQLGDMSRAA